MIQIHDSRDIDYMSNVDKLFPALDMIESAREIDHHQPVLSPVFVHKHHFVIILQPQIVASWDYHMSLFGYGCPDKIGLLDHILFGINWMAYIFTRNLIFRITYILAFLPIVPVFFLDPVLFGRS